MTKIVVTEASYDPVYDREEARMKASGPKFDLRENGWYERFGSQYIRVPEHNQRASHKGKDASYWQKLQVCKGEKRWEMHWADGSGYVE